jgi:hypothetical protein
MHPLRLLTAGRHMLCATPQALRPAVGRDRPICSAQYAEPPGLGNNHGQLTAAAVGVVLQMLDVNFWQLMRQPRWHGAVGESLRGGAPLVHLISPVFEPF